MRTTHGTTGLQAGLFTEEPSAEPLPEEAIRGMVVSVARLLLDFLHNEAPENAERSERESQDHV
jgi:hypothetical protein